MTDEMDRNAIKWMQKNGIRVSLINLTKWTGIDFCSKEDKYGEKDNKNGKS